MRHQVLCVSHVAKPVMGNEALTLGSGHMDMMGDAEQYKYDDELPLPREPLLTTEALAVT